MTHTPTQRIRDLRKLARYLEQPNTTRPADAPPDLEPEAIELIDATLTIFFEGPTALRRARDYGGRGHAGGGQPEGRGKGGHSSPTEQAALNDRADNFTQAGDTVLAKTTQATAAANVAAHTIRQLLTSAPPVADVDRCKTPDCDDIDGKDGYCLACHRYVNRNGHMPDAETLRARRSERRLSHVIAP